MTSSAANICILSLVLLCLQQICHCRPHRNERGLVKDYFVPDSLVFSSDKFEKGEDGKYHLKKSAHRSDSEVKYSSPAGRDNSLQDEDPQSGETVTDSVQTETTKTESLKEEVAGLVTPADVESTSSIAVEEVKVSEKIKNNPKTESIIEETAAKGKTSSKKAPFTPVDPKFVPPKPDSKDEVPMKTNPPVEEKVDEKITIGEVPDLYSRFVPLPGTFRVPVLIPVRQISYGALKVVPLAPADLSDRLPLPYEDDIIGEGAHESESEGVSEPITEEKKDIEYRLGNPLSAGLPLPPLSFGSILKDMKEADKQNSEKQSKVVDVLGKKFLMQSNVMKYPTGGNGHMYLRFLSVKPLEDPKSLVPKEIAAEEEEMARKEIKELEKKKEESAVKEIVKKKESALETEMKKEEELLKEPEVLKVEETKIKMNVEQEVPKEVILRNMGGSEVKMEGSEGKETKSAVSAIDEMKIHNIGHSILTADESNPMKKTEEGIMKNEGEDAEMKTDFELKDGFVMKEEEEEEDRSVSEETDEKKIETADSLLRKEDAKKEMEIASKKEYFLAEKKKKDKFFEENEKVKPKKKSDKKKKCKCEEKDSDSEGEDE